MLPGAIRLSTLVSYVSVRSPSVTLCYRVPSTVIFCSATVEFIIAPSATVSFDGIAERVAERAEPRLKVSPLVEALAINRPAHLL